MLKKRCSVAVWINPLNYMGFHKKPSINGQCEWTLRPSAHMSVLFPQFLALKGPHMKSMWLFAPMRARSGEGCASPKHRCSFFCTLTHLPPLKRLQANMRMAAHPRCKIPTTVMLILNRPDVHWAFWFLRLCEIDKYRTSIIMIKLCVFV